MTTRDFERCAEYALRPLVDQAMDLRSGPYFSVAIAAIVDAFDRRHLVEHERRQARTAALVQVLRETDPDRIAERRAA